jgi:hypothetical protein
MQIWFVTVVPTYLYEVVSKSFRTGRLEQELQMVQLSAIRCSCIAIVWISLVGFAAITLCVASQRVFIVVYFGNFLIHPRMCNSIWISVYLRKCDDVRYIDTSPVRQAERSDIQSTHYVLTLCNGCKERLRTWWKKRVHFSPLVSFILGSQPRSLWRAVRDSGSTEEQFHHQTSCIHSRVGIAASFLWPVPLAYSFRSKYLVLIRPS